MYICSVASRCILQPLRPGNRERLYLSGLDVMRLPPGTVQPLDAEINEVGRYELDFFNPEAYIHSISHGVSITAFDASSAAVGQHYKCWAKCDHFAGFWEIDDLQTVIQHRVFGCELIPRIEYEWVLAVYKIRSLNNTQNLPKRVQKVCHHG